MPGQHSNGSGLLTVGLYQVNGQGSEATKGLKFEFLVHLPSLTMAKNYTSPFQNITCPS